MDVWSWVEYHRVHSQTKITKSLHLEVGMVVTKVVEELDQHLQPTGTPPSRPGTPEDQRSTVTQSQSTTSTF